MNKTPNPSEARSPKTTSSASSNKKNIAAKIIAVAIALGLWQVASFFVSDLLFVSPWQVLKRLFSLVGEEGFFATVWFSLSRILIGFFMGAVLGIILALPAGRFPLIETLLWPYMITIKSVPVASFIAIAFIWLTSSNISILISMLMAMPIVYTNLLEGIRSVDKKMITMSEVFRMPFGRRLHYIWLPTIKPYLISGISIALALSWKAGIAVELIGYPNGSIGEALYYAKQYYETADLFAWTFVIVLIAFVFEKLFVASIKLIYRRIEK